MVSLMLGCPVIRPQFKSDTERGCLIWKPKHIIFMLIALSATPVSSYMLIDWDRLDEKQDRTM